MLPTCNISILKMNPSEQGDYTKLVGRVHPYMIYFYSWHVKIDQHVFLLDPLVFWIQVFQ
jgi:hypothetical protein